MKATLIVYNLSNLDQYSKIILNRKMFGYTNNSNNNQYHYKIKGILSEIPHFRLPKGALIIKSKDRTKITSLLNKHKAKIRTFDISITSSMLQKN